jgi:hypothetical protein
MLTSLTTHNADKLEQTMLTNLTTIMWSSLSALCGPVCQHYVVMFVSSYVVKFVSSYVVKFVSIHVVKFVSIYVVKFVSSYVVKFVSIVCSSLSALCVVKLVSIMWSSL